MATSPKTPLKFPAKLYRILETPEFNDIICWLPHGRSWRVLQQERFEKEVLPTFFRHGRYASFIRQVNGWGFRRIQSGPDFNSYYHESFYRDSPESCRSMTRPSAQEVADRKNGDFDPPKFHLLASSKPSHSEQAGENATVVPASLTNKAPLDYRSYLISRLLSCSAEEKEMVLNLELQQLEEQRKSISRQLLALQVLNRSPSESPLAQQSKPSEVPSTFSLQNPMDAYLRLSVLGQMQLRSQLLACGGM